MELLPVGNQKQYSADFTVSIGSPVALFLVSDTPPDVHPAALVNVMIKSSAGHYFNVGTIKPIPNGALLTAPGTYRVCREQPLHESVSVGVEAYGVE